jgi:hypothetical protein
MASKQRQIERWNNLKQPIMDNLTCYICNYQNKITEYKQYIANDIFNAGELIRYQCPICETIFGDLRFLQLPHEEISRDYEDVYSYYNEGDATDLILQVFADIPFFYNKSFSYLDYACGKWNRLVSILKNQGYNIDGYDKYVNNNSYIINTLISDKKYDIIYNNNYIEHLIDPIQEIKNITNLLNDNGILVCITECFKYCIEFTHYHTFFFNDKSLLVICDKLDLELIYSKDYSFTMVRAFKKKLKL